MPRYSAAIALNFSCQILCAAIALDLSLIVTRCFPCALAHSNAARMMRSTPFAVFTSSETYSSPLVRPRPVYWPSVFSRKMTKSMGGSAGGGEAAKDPDAAVELAESLRKDQAEIADPAEYPAHARSPERGDPRGPRAVLRRRRPADVQTQRRSVSRRS